MKREDKWKNLFYILSIYHSMNMGDGKQPTGVDAYDHQADGRAYEENFMEDEGVENADVITDMQESPVRLRARNTDLLDNTSAMQALARGMTMLNENPSTEENLDEIRNLDSQLDHLNDYMNKIEEKITVHHQKLTEQLQQQREEREERRRSFHQRLQTSQQEDNDFHSQVSEMLNRIQSSQRQSAVAHSE